MTTNPQRAKEWLLHAEDRSYAQNRLLLAELLNRAELRGLADGERRGVEQCIHMISDYESAAACKRILNAVLLQKNGAKPEDPAPSEEGQEES